MVADMVRRADRGKGRRKSMIGIGRDMLIWDRLAGEDLEVLDPILGMSQEVAGVEHR